MYECIHRLICAGCPGVIADRHAAPAEQSRLRGGESPAERRLRVGRSDGDRAVRDAGGCRHLCQLVPAGGRAAGRARRRPQLHRCVDHHRSPDRDRSHELSRDRPRAWHRNPRLGCAQPQSPGEPPGRRVDAAHRNLPWSRRHRARARRRHRRQLSVGGHDLRSPRVHRDRPRQWRARHSERDAESRSLLGPARGSRRQLRNQHPAHLQARAHPAAHDHRLRIPLRGPRRHGRRVVGLRPAHARSAAGAHRLHWRDERAHDRWRQRDRGQFLDQLPGAHHRRLLPGQR